MTSASVRCVLSTWTAPSAMVNGAVHYLLVLDGHFEEERLVATLTRLWAQALGLPVRP